ncbi:geminin coiled-coil domain-containing protein 1 [Colossoma macropomum]|uniref:geminin coiled-coil domain-containing protein 1 n=1 Tax=Colossoma macropomum TaxID=42526 RepID=UPI0018655783|nr:geminin coiled-coil domain-containing protein 1 [Colossoma macropomum]
MAAGLQIPAVIKQTQGVNRMPIRVSERKCISAPPASCCASGAQRQEKKRARHKCAESEDSLQIGARSGQLPALLSRRSSRPARAILAREMSAILSCQDAGFAGGVRYACAYTSSPPPRATVDVSTATLAPLWDAGALDNAGCQHEPPRPDPQLGSVHTVLHDSTWPDQLSPHLQRNKQLQDTLMQKEEELARLQEENNKLKEFLNSSYVKSLAEKSKRLFSAQRNSDTRQRKRTLHEEGDFLNLSRLLQGGKSKRVCRNLSLEFCSAEELAATPRLDSWILETLGLQDEDTIDPDGSFSSPTTDHIPSFNSPAPSIDHFSPATHDSTTCSPNTNNHREYGLTDSLSSFSHNMDTSTEYSTLYPSPLYTVTSTGSLVTSLPAIVPGLFTPPRAASTPHRSHSTSSGQHYHSSPESEGILFSTPRTTRSRTDLAFSMSLSPQSSVKTHTFPQGQAFTRRDSQGGWNFTWVPKQCS